MNCEITIPKKNKTQILLAYDLKKGNNDENRILYNLYGKPESRFEVYLRMLSMRAALCNSLR